MLTDHSHQVSYNCGQTAYYPAWCDNTKNNIDDFANKYGYGYCAAGPNACSRMGCSYDNAILMCAGAQQAVVPCTTVAQNFYFVDFTCATASGYSKEKRRETSCTVEGQAFYINPSYNVSIHTTPIPSCHTLALVTINQRLTLFLGIDQAYRCREELLNVAFVTSS